MTNPNGNPDIVAHGEATQFGNAQDPAQVGAKASPWSIRHMVRYFAANEIDPEDMEAVSRFLGKKPTLAQQAALKALKKAAIDGDMRAIEYSTEQIDGKLPQTLEGNPDKPLGTSIVTLRVDSA